MHIMAKWTVYKPKLEIKITWKVHKTGYTFSHKTNAS